MELRVRTLPHKEASTKERPLYVAILVSLVGLAIITYFGATTDLYDWEVDITRWVQRFSLGPARFLTSWMFWMGVKGVAGAVLAGVVALFWLYNRRIEAIFLLLIAIPDFFNILLREIISRPRPLAELVAVLDPGSQGSSFPSGTLQIDRCVRLKFHGVINTSDAGLLAYRELDDALGLCETATTYHHESRIGRNVQHRLVALLRQNELRGTAWVTLRTPESRIKWNRLGRERQLPSNLALLGLTQ